MRKIVFLLFIIVFLLCLINKEDKIIIPSNAIRLRVIANSDNVEDQKIKAQVKNEINNYFNEKMSNVKSYDEAKKIVSNSIKDLNPVVSKYTNNFTLSYGNNYFPEKEYKGVTYNAGNYESIVIKIGSGLGNNFWCVLFPPLCMIDEEKMSNVEYSLYIKELLNKFI